MQNTVDERKQNGEDFFSSLAVTYSRFGNCPTNDLVTEQPQYSVVVCIFSTSQNAEISLIPNGLHFIFTYPQSLALAILLHTARHSFACTVALRQGIPKEVLQIMMGHTSIKTTEIYAKLPMQVVSQQLDKKLFLTWK